MVQKIDKVLRTTLTKQSASTKSILQNLSTRQQSEIEKFLEVFPTIEKVYKFFQPDWWGHALCHTQECLTFPCISLAMVDEVYHTEGAAKNIVRGQFLGIYALSTAKDPYNTQSSNLSADLFIARYGHSCSLYDLQLYFGSYLTDFKGTFSPFDTQDILLQFSHKFLPWKRSKLQINDENTQETLGCGGLFNALVLWMKGDSDEEIKKGGLYAIGRINDTMIKAARDEYRKRMEGEVF